VVVIKKTLRQQGIKPLKMRNSRLVQFTCCKKIEMGILNSSGGSHDARAGKWFGEFFLNRQRGGTTGRWEY